MLDASLHGGVVVCQQWQLRRGLGSSPGQAWEAEDLRSGRRVAIKFLRGSLSLDEPARQRFEREARAFGRVRSPHYVQILDQGVSEHGVPFLVSERLDGEDLGALLARQPRLGLLEAGLILDQLLRGLARLQSLRLVHRDIKPENVFLSDDSAGQRTVKLLDFGYVKRAGRETSPLTSHRAWQNGASYWSPEQIATPARVDQRTDVWAVGVLGYRMITGRLPFPGDDWATLAQRAQIGKFAQVSVIRPDLPAALDGWFRDMLQPDPSARFAGAERARLALEQILRACALLPAEGAAPVRIPRGPPPLPRSARPPLPGTASVPAPTSRADAPEVLAEQDGAIPSPAELAARVAIAASAESTSQLEPAEGGSSVSSCASGELGVDVSTSDETDAGSSVVRPASGDQSSEVSTAAGAEASSSVSTCASGDPGSEVSTVDGGDAGSPASNCASGSEVSKLDVSTSDGADTGSSASNYASGELASEVSKSVDEDAGSSVARPAPGDREPEVSVSGDAEVGSSVVSFVSPSAGVDVGSQLVTHPAAETSSQLVAYVAPERSSRPVISAVAKRSARVVASSARPAAEQGVRVGTLLVCGLLLILLCAGLFALRAGRMSGLRSQAAAAENARPAAVVRPQRSAAVGQPQRSAALAEPPRSAAVASARAEPTVPTGAVVQLSAAIEPPAPPAEPNLALPVKLSTPVAAERLRSRSAGARLSSGPAAMPVMEGGPRDRRSRKPEPLPAAPEIGADPPPAAPSAPPPAATRPYRGF